MKVKSITVKYREPTPEELADRERRRIVFADGSTGLIMNELNERREAIITRDKPLTILIDKTDWSKVEISIGDIKIDKLGY